MKKTKLPGENISLKTKKSEDPLVMQWLNAQSNLMDSLRYLIEKEIYQNGVRNLQAYVPAERSVLHGGSAEAQEVAFVPVAAGKQETAAAAEAAQEAERLPDAPQAAPEEEIDEEDIEAWI
ncbi:hypothetical protein [Paenibacillus arenilitoris]|uniref:Uncharacterized protein n=1 Tax=Paenibacillus arenilitoris TaxID=2772299 RepID=A0A927H681_9BACL|nr:hypothetical protein [Paenibacillus arenilitoris]MBD2870271.1 hypothetical protein [Paenibacillus arenilitoris]